MKKQIETLLSKKMDRKDFLKYAATAGLMTVGGGVILKSITGLNTVLSPTAQSHQQVASVNSMVGYGTSVYGGRGAGL